MNRLEQSKLNVGLDWTGSLNGLTIRAPNGAKKSARYCSFSPSWAELPIYAVIRSVQTETLYNLSSSKNITESLKNFGGGDSDHSFVVAGFGVGLEAARGIIRWHCIVFKY